MTPEEECFSELLSRLKNSSPYPHKAVTETPADRLTDLDIAIWIMESKESKEIFHEGRLKGSKKATTGRPQYNSHPIKDLETLVRDAALKLFMWLQCKELKWTDREGPTKSITELFDRLLQAYDEMALTVSSMISFRETTIKKTAISNTRKVIKGWKMRALKDVKPGIGEADIKEDLAKLFITHVPEAEPARIAKCVNVLLSPAPFKVDVNIGTFRKKVKKWKEYIELDREY